MWQSKKEKKIFSQSSNIFCLRQNSQMTLFGMKGAICGNLLLFAKKQRKLVPQLGPQDAPFPSLSCVCRVPSVLLQWQTQRMFASPHTSLALTSSCSKDSRLSECCSGLNSGQQLPWGGGEGGGWGITPRRCLYLVPFWPLLSFLTPKCRLATPTPFGLASVSCKPSS